MFDGLVVSVLFSLLAHVSYGIEVRFGTDALKQDRVLSQVMSKNADTVFEARVGQDDAFEIVRSFYGELDTGDRVAFTDVTIRRAASSREYLARLTRETPMLSQPVPEDCRITLPQVADVAELPRPATDARFVLLVAKRNGHDKWNFPRQTHGDFYLVQEDRVYFFDYGLHDDRSVGFWVPFDRYPNYPSFVNLLTTELRKRKPVDATDE
jgi:hypothetical protein